MITLHTIFSNLVDDPDFLVIKQNYEKSDIKTVEKKTGFNMMTDMISDYVSLTQSDVQKCSLFPSEFKDIIPINYMRCGVKNISERNFVNANISFLNSLNILLRPEIFKMPIEEQIRNYELFENFIIHKINGNCRVDKVKNTKKIQNMNKEISKNITSGKIIAETVQSIINIFEINLLIFDFIKNEIVFYWSYGHTYPHINLFNNLYCMSYIHEIYEPIMPVNEAVREESIRKMYVNILTNDSVFCPLTINFNVKELLVLNDWDIDALDFVTIANKYIKVDNMLLD